MGLEYAICGVDGSQIYPDRHHGMSYALINVGGALFDYKTESSVEFFSLPEFVEISAETNDSDINQLRGERELGFGIEMGERAQRPLMLLDGSLLWFHLAASEEQRAAYISRLCSFFELFYEKRILYAGYVSLPRSRELLQIVRAAGDGTDHFLYATDIDLIADWLPEHHRTTLFLSRSSASALYVSQIRPAFCYLNIGDEIGRVELPWWIASDQQLFDRVIMLIADQINKGRGYPICLTHAHEQAVVSEPDRRFCLSLLHELQRDASSGSQKRVSKRNKVV